MHVDPDIGVCHAQGAVEAGHQQRQKRQVYRAHQLTADDQGAGQEIELLQSGQRSGVSVESGGKQQTVAGEK